MKEKNKENGLKRKIKIGISLVIISLLIVSSVGISTLTITDEGLEFSDGRWFSGESDYVVWRTNTGSYVAKNMNNGTMYTSGSSDLADLLNRIILEMYTHNYADYGSVYGGKISLKSGRYNLYNQVNLMPGTCIEGQGGMKDAADPATTIVDYAADSYLFFYDGSLSSGCSIAIKNIAIKNYGAGVGKTIIYMNRTCGSLIEGVTIMQGVAGTYKHGIYLGSHSHVNHIVNCDIYNAAGAGIYLETTHLPFLCCNANVIRDSRSRANLDGIYIDEGCVGNIIEGCAIEANSRYGINLADDGGDTYDYGADKTTIHATHFEDDIAIRIYGGYGTTIDSCYSYSGATGTLISINRTNLPEGTTISNVYIPSTVTSYLNFSGNNTLIEGNFVPGIKIEEGNHTTIISNTLTNATLGLVLNGTNTPNTKIYSNNLNGGSIAGYQNDTTMFDNVGFSREQLSGLDYIYDNSTQAFKFLRTADKSSFYGGSGINDCLAIYASTNAASPRIELKSSGDRIDIQASDVRIYQDITISTTTPTIETSAGDLSLSPGTGNVTINDVLCLNPIASEPLGATDGMIYFNSTTKMAYCYNSTAWNALW